MLDDLDTSRGAFYHYFDSKAALLDSVVERMVDDATAALVPMIDGRACRPRCGLPALFNGLAQWKSERTDLLHAVMETWLADENAIVREKFRARRAGADDSPAGQDHRTGSRRRGR